jgi:hypothetical protein
MKSRLNLGAGHIKKALIGIVLLALCTQCALFGNRGVYVVPDEYSTTVSTKIQDPTPPYDYSSFQFYDRNKTYDYPGESMTWAPIGEKFLLKYDPLVPEGNYEYKCLEVWHPVFLPGEVTNYTVGTVVNAVKKYILFDYMYIVDGEKYVRSQYITNADKVRTCPQVAKGARFLVEYLVEDPERAIIYLDKPKTYIDNSKGDSLLVPDINTLRPRWYSIPVELPDPELTRGRSGW